MSIFKSRKTAGDRSATDRQRHKSKIRDAIQEGVYHIVSDESIIGQDGKKRIKIPVRGIKEYRFIYGDNESNKKVGSAPGKDIKRGQKVGEKAQKRKNGSGPGTEPGEEFYEVEITLEELSYYLFDGLNLPELEKKKFKKMVGEESRRKGYRDKGIRPLLSKRETLKNKIKRKKKSAIVDDNDQGTEDEMERFPFHQSDLRYKKIKINKKENNNAVIFFVMDTSGSMTVHKKFMARSYFFLLYHFLRHKYNKVDIVFISHDSDAREVSEDDFFRKGSSGGTLISSAVEMCLSICDQRYHSDSWNIYTFHCSDGDNWPEDVEKSISLSKKLKSLCQLYCFIQINLEGSGWLDGGMASKYVNIQDSKFKIIQLDSITDIWPSFNKLFGGTS